MLTLKFREEEKSHPLMALCPWIDFINIEQNLILNKDGSILAGFTFTGMDPDNLYDEMVNANVEHLERAIQQFDERITAWWIVDKRRDRSYPKNTFTNETAAKLDKEYSKSFTSGQYYRTTFQFYLLYSVSGGTDRILDATSRIQSETGAPLSKALMTAVKESFSGRTAFARDLNALEENVSAFEKILNSFVDSCPLNFKRLEGNYFASSLASILNRGTKPGVWDKPPGTLLDNWAPQDYLAYSKEMVKFTGNTDTTYGGAIGIKKWRKKTTPMLFETIYKLDMEMTICQVVRFLGKQKSESEIRQSIQYYEMTQYPMIAHAIAKLTGSEATPSPGKAALLEQCHEAMESINDDKNGAYFALNVFIWGDSPKQLKDNITAASQKLSEMKFVVTRERMNTLPSFAAILPGQWSQQSRYDYLTVENLADLCPMYTMGEGSRRSPFMSEVIGRSVPALAQFGTTYGGVYNFNPHVGQVGHMLMVAPTGGGKTTFVNFALSQFLRYPDAQIIVFDRNRSCQIVTELHRGTHIDIAKKKAKWNPLSVLRDGTSDGLTWVREYILRRLAEGNYVSTAEDRQSIDVALQQIRNNTDLSLRMSTLAMLLPQRLTQELGEWLEGRPYGMFDTEEDDFALSDWTTIEMKEIMKVERLARAFLDYAFRKIETSLTGRPTFIYLEEASFLLKFPAFKDMLDEWLKTFRKLNAFLWLTLQSPESIANDDMAATLLDNVSGFIMCVNKKVESHREAYKKNFALEDHQVDMIAKLEPNKDYLLIQNDQAKVLRTKFSKKTLAYIRSEIKMLQLFEKHKESKDPNWIDNYLEAAASA